MNFYDPYHVLILKESYLMKYILIKSKEKKITKLDFYFILFIYD